MPPTVMRTKDLSKYILLALKNATPPLLTARWSGARPSQLLGQCEGGSESRGRLIDKKKCTVRILRIRMKNYIEEGGMASRLGMRGRRAARRQALAVLVACGGVIAALVVAAAFVGHRAEVGLAAGIVGGGAASEAANAVRASCKRRE